MSGSEIDACPERKDPSVLHTVSQGVKCTHLNGRAGELTRRVRKALCIFTLRCLADAATQRSAQARAGINTRQSINHVACRASRIYMGTWAQGIDVTECERGSAGGGGS